MWIMRLGRVRVGEQVHGTELPQPFGDGLLPRGLPFCLATVGARGGDRFNVGCRSTVSTELWPR
jgi:hypothetical protein